MQLSELPLNRVLHGDSIEIMSSFPEGSVDLIFSDPPYNLQLAQDLWRPNLTRVDAVDDEWDQFESFAAYDEFTCRWLTACRRVLKDNGTLWVIGTYHNILRTGKILQDLGFWILNSVVWIKTNPMPNFRGVRFTNSHEILLWAQKERGQPYTFNHHAMKALNEDLQMRSDWVLPLCTGKERIKVNGVKAHATQKPEALLYRVILSSSKPGEVVLDPFFGTGTTGAVAKKLKRNWIGIEQDAEYVRIAQERVEAVEALEDTSIFVPREKRSRPRIAFGQLLEQGLLEPGQTLFFGRNSNVTALILADGHLRCGQLTGSIHEVAKALRNAPCNGWEHWYFVDEFGQRVVIDQLRQKVREMMEE